MADPNECPICCGDGTYPIFDRTGLHVYSIPCPECYGLGHIEPEPTKSSSEVES